MFIPNARFIFARREARDALVARREARIKYFI